jgi:hypothetical protein
MNRLNEAYALCHVSVDVFLLILIRLRSCGKEKKKTTISLSTVGRAWAAIGYADAVEAA